MSSVFLSNVDDYLSPSQACINPLFASDPTKEDQGRSSGIPSGSGRSDAERIRISNDSVPDPVPSRRRRRVKRVAVGTEDHLRRQADDTSTRNGTTKATVTMADCLACSGCVTTAESVLVEQHSLDTLKKRTRDMTGTDEVVVTVSPASLADLKRHLNGGFDNRKFTTFLHRSLKATFVMDGNLPLSWSLGEAASEFVHAYRNGRSSQSPPSPTVAHSALEYQVVGESIVRKNDYPPPPCSSLPILSSSCPALVCLVEKSFARAVPHLSKVKSPMAAAAAFWKHGYGCNGSRKGGDCKDKQGSIFHVALMPCHDKKLEASRKDLSWKSGGVDGVLEPEVDLVVTTREILDLLEEAATGKSMGVADFVDSLPPAPVLDASKARINVSPVVTMMELEGSALVSGCWIDFSCGRPSQPIPDFSAKSSFFPRGSGGYAEYIFCHACKELFGYDVPAEQSLRWNPIDTAPPTSPASKSQRTVVRRRRKSTSFLQLCLFLRSDGSYTLEHDGDDSDNACKPVLQFAAAYGMQSLQRTLQGFKQESSAGGQSGRLECSSATLLTFDYVEAMACPTGGCLNGGGQIFRRPAGSGTNTRESPSDTRQRVQKTWSKFTVPLSSTPSRESPAPIAISTKSGSMDTLNRFALYTRFHVVPAMEHSMGAAAGLKVQDTQW